MKLRRAAQGDCDRLFEWRNRPEIVALGSGRRPVALNEHRTWFTQLLGSAEMRLYIVESDEGVPIGQVRFDPLTHGEAVVSIYLLAGNTGRGEGTAALSASVDRAGRELRLTRVWATIRDDNLVSVKSFQRAGFALATGREPARLSHPGHHVYLRELI